MNDIEKLTELFIKFPGIGTRQAKRFVFFILTRSPAWRSELIRTIQSIESSVHQCVYCKRYATECTDSSNPSCKICANSERDKTKLLVVEKDVDVDSIEKSGEYKGLYFVLGGTIPISNTKRIYARNKELYEYIKNNLQKNSLQEVVLALSATVDGEYTVEVLSNDIKEINNLLKITVLGRGLSTGSEIEYADTQTIKNALKNRA